MNKLIEFLHDPESKGLILGNNGFRADLQGWNARTFVEVSAYTAETYADTPDWYEEWEMPIHIPDASGIDVLQIVEAVVARLKSLAFDEVVYPLEAIE